MTEPNAADDGATVDDPLEDFREAAAAVVSSLKQLAQAAEKVIEDPETFARVAASGKAVVDAFLTGFSPPAGDHSDGPEDDQDSDTVPG